MAETVAGPDRAAPRALFAVGKRASPLPLLVVALVALAPRPADVEVPLVHGGVVEAWLLEDGEVTALRDGAVVAPGARVQLGYAAPALLPPARQLYAVLFSVDDRGRRTLHFPRHPDDDTRLERARGVLPASFELDDTPGSERFYLVLAAGPLPVAAALAAADACKPSFLLRKAPSTPMLRAPRGEEVR